MHVGIHKTGSTLLQLTLFAETGSVKVLGARGSPPVLNAHCRQLWSRDYGSLNLNRWSEVFLELCADHGLNQDALALSDENLSGHMITGSGSRLIAERLAGLWPDARILMVLRDPVAYALSAYDEYTRLGGAASFRMFCHDRILPAGLMNRLDYRRLVDDYYELFGQEAVLVLPYELLADNRLAFAELIAEHFQLSTDSNSFDALDRTYNARSSGLRRTMRRVGNFLGTRQQITWQTRPRSGRKARCGWLVDRSRSTALAALLSINDEDGRLDHNIHDVLSPSRMGFWSGVLERYNYSVTI